MKLWKTILCLLLCLALLGGCGSEVVPDPAQTHPGTTQEADSADDTVVVIGQDLLPISEEMLYYQLFDPNNKIDIHIDMPASELQKLQEDYSRYSALGSKSPIYRMADVTITITTPTSSTAYRIPEVGVRMKGNTSRTDFYSAQEGIYNNIHLKLDFQETFDEMAYYGNDAKVWPDMTHRDARKDRTFATLEKLEMRWNKCYDQTYLKESYAYALYRAEGVMAPLTNLCSFDWSGIHMGVYVLVEPVDKAFLKKRLPKAESDGDLYKCGWPADFTNSFSVGIEDEDRGQFYVYDLKNNKKTSDHSALKSFIAALNRGDMTKESLAELVDMDYFLSYAAVSYFLGNPDDFRNNYNNFYLYFLPSTGKAVIIPYDCDRCLGVTYEWDPSGNGMTQEDPFSELVAGGDSSGEKTQRNPLVLYSVVRGGYYVNEFADALGRVARNPLLDPQTFESWVNRAKTLYAEDVVPGKSLYNSRGRQFGFILSDGVGGNLSFRTYITRKLASYQSCMEKLGEYQDYVRPEKTVYYIRGNFTDWTSREAYGMRMENGKAVITLTFTNTAILKVYNQEQDLWWGAAYLSPDTTVYYESESEHENLLLPPGTYRICFDPQTQRITVTQG